MRLEEIGYEIRRARIARGLTQAQLAARARVTRTTLNQLENGTLKDLGIRKVEQLLKGVGLTLLVDRGDSGKRTDYLRLASTSASVSLQEALTEDELLRALMTGRVPANRRPHLRTLLEEASPTLIEGLIRQVGSWSRPGRIERSLDKIATTVGVGETVRRLWTKAS